MEIVDSPASAAIRWRPRVSFPVALYGLIAAGTIARLAVAVSLTHGVYDLDVDWRAMAHALQGHSVAEAYSAAPGHWSYPPAYLLVIRIADILGRHSPFDFAFYVRLPAIAADGAIAWLVQDVLRQRGYTRRQRLVATALVSAGPAFGIISAYTSQFDAVVVLPTVFAVWIWGERPATTRRAALTGVLVGISYAIKTVGVLMILAFLPSCRSWRQRAALVASTGVVALLSWVPVLSNLRYATEPMTYNGFPGVGGASLALQPSLAEFWLFNRPLHFSSITQFFYQHRGSLIFLGLALLAAFGLAIQRRLPPLYAGVLIWLAVYAFGYNYSHGYIIWGLPLFLMVGNFLEIAMLEAALAIAIGVLFLQGTYLPHLPPERPLGPAFFVYVPIMVTVWVALLIAFGRTLLRTQTRNLTTGI